MRYIIICGLFILLANCTMTTSNHGSRYGYGSSISLFINRFGQPDQKVMLATGNMIYFYTKTNPRYAKVSTLPPVQLNVDSSGKPVMLVKAANIAENNLAFTCAIMFIVDKRGIIIDSKVQGEGCNELLF